MKLKRIFRNITIVFTITIVILDIILFVNMRQSYESSEIFTTIFEFGTFIYGLLLLPIVWIQYFLIIGIAKLYNKYIGFKKWLIMGLLAVIEILLIIIGIRILVVIFLFMGILN